MSRLADRLKPKHQSFRENYEKFAILSLPIISLWFSSYLHPHRIFSFGSPNSTSAERVILLRL
jgi:hypothetical protein